MMSNKWAFSLTSLITILALAFVVPSAMAAIEITLNADAEDVSYADNIQVPYGEIVTIKVTSDKVINIADAEAADAEGGDLKNLTNEDFTVTTYNEFGGTSFTGTAPTLGDLTNEGDADGKHFMADLTAVTAPADDATGTAVLSKVIISLAADSVELADPSVDQEKNTKKSITIYYVGVEADDDTTTDVDESVPMVHKIERAGNELRPVTAATFDVIITLSEEPRKDGFKKDHINVTNATAGDPTLLGMIDVTNDMPSTGRDDMLYRYVVTITPKYENKNDIVIKVKEFYDQEKLRMRKYTPHAVESSFVEGEDKLTVKVGKEVLKDKAAGLEVVIPKEKRIPASGYIVFTKDAIGDAGKSGGAAILRPAGSDKDEPKRNERSETQMLYNVVQLGGLPNLESFLANGGTIDLVGSGLYISEIMWGSDASQDPNNNSQWIEIANSGSSSILTGDKTHKLIFYGPNEALPDVSTVADRVGTVGAGGHWQIAGKGQSGRSGTGEKAADIVAVVPTQALISMQRVMGADGTPADGTLAGSWAASTPPGLNFDPAKVGTRIGTPGAAPVSYPVAPTPEPEPEPAAVIPVAMGDDIMITEIMVNTNSGRLPQWIELTSVATGEVSLEGWEMVIDNAIDADVLGGGNAITVSLSGVTLDVSAHTGNMGKGQSALVVAWAAPRMSDNIRADRIINVGAQLGQTRRYQLLSYNGFRITLVPPQMGAIADFGDIAGNLHEDWELPMDGRSSLIRHEMDAAGTSMMGTDLNGWKLASGTDLVTGQESYYGDDEDQGTPGHDAGGPLPVELSHFRPARDKATGAVVITWATESELNNAGFFIKRSQQRNGEFKVINAAMVPGAGTTSEKQFYTYTDTTAQPNVVYYYQIEDVSLDGNRQTLTRGIRLKGHVGAAGKLTSTWGELKTSHE